jgi:hypothetical protein
VPDVVVRLLHAFHCTDTILVAIGAVFLGTQRLPNRMQMREWNECFFFID